MTSDKPIRMAFNTHGLGDVVHCATAMRLYIDRGYDVAIQVEPNKRWVWEAAGVPIYDGPDPLPLHPYYYPDMRKYFDLSEPDEVYNKAAHLFEVTELPNLGTKEEVWKALCEVRLDASPHISPEAHAEAEAFLEGLPRPIFVLHSKGTNWQAEKSIPDGIAFELLFKLLDTGGSVVVLDYDARVPVVTGHPRVRSIKAVGGGGWGHIGCDRLCALLSRTDLFIGVDSGPFHVASLMTNVKCLGVFRKIPPVRCCLPSRTATYLVPAADHDHWAARGAEWKFVEYSMDEVSAADIAVVAINIVFSEVSDMSEIKAEDLPGVYTYRRVGHDERLMELLPNGKIGQGTASCERTWRLAPTPHGVALGIFSDNGGDTCWLTLENDRVWRGRWLNHEQMPIELAEVTEKTDSQDVITSTDVMPAERPTVKAEHVPGFYNYHRVGFDLRVIELRVDGSGGIGTGCMEHRWKVTVTPDGPALTLYDDAGRVTCNLSPCEDGALRGQWLQFEQMPIVLTPTESPFDGANHPSDLLPDAPVEFYVGIPTYICFDLLHKCLESILANEWLPRRIYVIDNSGGKFPGHPSRRVQVFTPTHNLGAGGSFNFLFPAVNPLPYIQLNDDIEIAPDLLRAMLTAEGQVIVGDGSSKGTAMMIRPDAWDRVGPFDPQFWPAYYEDCDWFYRAGLQGISPICPRSGGFHNNGPSATKARMTPADRQVVDNQYAVNTAYYRNKWGGPPHQEVFIVPFNGVAPS